MNMRRVLKDMIEKERAEYVIQFVRPCGHLRTVFEKNGVRFHVDHGATCSDHRALKNIRGDIRRKLRTLRTK